jgi:hypothetical protein
MNAMKRCVLCTTGFGILVGSIALAAISITGCGGATAGAFQSAPTTVPLAERSYRFAMHGLKGKACRLSILGFGIADRSYAAAIGEIHKQVPPKYQPEYQLVNVVSDWSFEFFLLGWENCTIVSADVVLLGPDLQVAPPAPGEAANIGAIPAGEKKETQGTIDREPPPYPPPPPPRARGFGADDQAPPPPQFHPYPACRNDKDCHAGEVCTGGTPGGTGFNVGKCARPAPAVPNPFDETTKQTTKQTTKNSKKPDTPESPYND